MKKQDWTDNEIIEIINGKSDSYRNKAFIHIFYERGWKETYYNWVIKKGGNAQDAKDAFQIAVIAFYKNLRQRNFKRESSLKTYFFTIAHRKWLDIMRKNRPVLEYKGQNFAELGGDVEEAYIQEERKDYLTQALQYLSERCRKMLKLYALNYSREEIAKEFQLSSAVMAGKETYRCRKRFHQFFKDNPNWKNLIN